MDADQHNINVFDCIVVGAGISGMCAARALLRADPECSVIVMEASARVGGRTESVDANDKGARIDLGGQWIGHSHQRARALVKELGLSLQPQFCVGRKILDLRGHVSTYSGDVPLGVSPFSLLDTHLLMQTIDQMCNLAPTDDPRNSPYAQDWDSQSVGSFMANQSTFDDTRALLTACVRGIFGVEPADISLLHFLTYIHSGGGLDSMVKVRRGAQDSTIVGGAQQLCERMVADFGSGDFKNGKVVLNTIVDRIENWGTKQTNHIQVWSTDGRMYHSKSLIVAVPPVICKTIHFSPQLPIARTHLQQRNFIGSVIKWVVLYDKPFWWHAGFSGEVVCDCTEGPVFNVYDDCVLNKDGSEQPALVLFCNGQPAREWSQRTVEERTTGILKQLVKWFGDEASNPVRVIEKNWVDDPWSRGCPVGIWPTGALWAAGHALRQPLGRLHFAGTEAATEHQGFMDGAISSGERAAAEVLLEWGETKTNTAPFKLPTQRKYREYRYIVAVAVLTLLIMMMLLMANRLVATESIEN